MSERKSAENLASIQTKYIEKNPLLRYANQRFLATVVDLTAGLEMERLLDAGCGEAIVMKRLSASLSRNIAVGIDIDHARLFEAQTRLTAPYSQADVQRLPFPSNAFDLVLCLEVLEHVGDPDQALDELHRVAGRYLIASVPHEPWWRLANIARLKYLQDWGNTPEHINHWSRRGFVSLIGRRFKILQTLNPVLWTFILAEKI